MALIIKTKMIGNDRQVILQKQMGKYTTWEYLVFGRRKRPNGWYESEAYYYRDENGLKDATKLYNETKSVVLFNITFPALR